MTALPESGFLANASQDLRDLLQRVAEEIDLADAEVLFEQGDEGDALYAVMSGAIELSVLSREGRKLTLDVVGPGALFGEIALFDPTTRTASAVAVGQTRLMRVRNAELLDELRRAPELAIDLVRLAGQRMRWMAKQLHEQVFLPMPSRLARKILHLTTSAWGAGDTLDMSQSELADFVGATREAVSKTLSGWKAKGVIENTRGGLRITDRDALQTLADFDYI
ncbi:MAG: Crp/Fnr family transcriptional regulator [Rhodobacteraceae bacterium]|nr:MAG: Crp/Fnr family transcriptional regulator [Paracoccaceae bacterium]